jgi:hypothetical protein
VRRRRVPLSERTIAQLDKALKYHREMEGVLQDVRKAVNDEPYTGLIQQILAAAALSSLQLQESLIVALVSALAEE